MCAEKVEKKANKKKKEPKAKRSYVKT